MVTGRIEWSGSIVTLLVWSKSIKEEVRKVPSRSGGGKRIVVDLRPDTANGQQDLLAKGLARLDVRLDEVAILQELRLLSVIVVYTRSAVSGEVGARVAVSMLRRLGHKAEGHVVDAIRGTILG